MKRQLNILTRPHDELARAATTAQQQEKTTEVVVIDLTIQKADYEELVREIFASEIVHVW